MLSNFALYKEKIDAKIQSTNLVITTLAVLYQIGKGKISPELLHGVAASNGTTTFLCPGIVIPNIKDVHGGMETAFEAAMDLLQKWEKDGTLKLHTLAQAMFKSAIGGSSTFC